MDTAVNRKPFGFMPDGTLVEELTLQDKDCAVSIITYGGAVRSIIVPGLDGPVDVALGFDTLENYLNHDKYFGALVGRYANRIGGASFTLNGLEYLLAANDGANHLRGGTVGFDKQVWTVEELTDNAVVLSLVSPDGQEGYPGTLSVQVKYELSQGALIISYQAQSTKTTLCNLTNHTYFNLSSHDSGPVTNQTIQIFSNHYTPTAPGSIPTGEIAPVEGTPMDLRTPQVIGDHINDLFPQLRLDNGYDHNWLVENWTGDESLHHIARAWSPTTGILMDVLTTMPGVQFYTGNFLDGCPAGKGGTPYQNFWGFCLETQYFPDSPHHPQFPSAVLQAGEVYKSQTEYHFSLSPFVLPHLEVKYGVDSRA